MKLNKIPFSDLSVSEICLGTMTFGEQNSETEAHDQLSYSADKGINFIDIAEMYPVPPKSETQGLSEKIVGNWLSSVKRENFIIATKITGPGRGFDWIRNGDCSINIKNIKNAVTNSLKRLKTDYIDLYQIHWPDRYVPTFGGLFYEKSLEREATLIQEQLEAFKTIIDAGYVRYIGLSNETPAGTLEFLNLSDRKSLPKVISIQNAYNLLNRSYETGLSEISSTKGIPLLSYSPLAFGHLTGKYLDGAKPENSRLNLFPSFGQRYEKVNVVNAVSAYNEIAKKYSLSLAQLSIGFSVKKWFVASTIIGATNLKQLEENIKSKDIQIDENMYKDIEDVFSKYPNPAV